MTHYVAPGRGGIWPRMLELERKAFGEALKRGLGPYIANGSDAGGYAWDEPLARELGLLVEYGMTPMQAIKAATTTAARLLGQEAQLGAIAPGRHADIIAVAGDPVADIAALGQVRWVMKGGTVHLTPMNELAQFALVTTTSVLFIVDPIAVIPTYLVITQDETREQRRRTARRACIAMTHAPRRVRRDRHARSSARSASPSRRSARRAG